MVYISLFLSLVSIVLVVAYINYSEERERNERDARKIYEDSIKHQLDSIQHIINYYNVDEENDGED